MMEHCVFRSGDWVKFTNYYNYRYINIVPGCYGYINRVYDDFWIQGLSISCYDKDLNFIGEYYIIHNSSKNKSFLELTENMGNSNEMARKCRIDRIIKQNKE